MSGKFRGWSVLLGLLLCVLPLTVRAQLRIVTWNISKYNGGKQSDIQTAVYATFNGRSLAPDIIICQEFMSSTAVNDFRVALNTAPGSPGDWAAAAFVNGPDTDSAFFYRTSKVRLLQQWVVSAGSSSSSGHPRHLMRYDIELKGYINAPPRIACYSTHMKAGSTSTDQMRRRIEAERIRANAETLPPDYSFIVAGDFNIPGASEAAYVELVSSRSNNRGRCFDPVNSPGNWNNNFSFRFLHTQDPAIQMDDRFDQILVSADLIDGNGLDYIGNPNFPFSTFTWNDPNHSYRTWGNDGGSYNTVLRTTGNTMVGPAIAQALINLADGSGHLPVYLELRLPHPLVVIAGSINLPGSASLAQPLTFEFRPTSGAPPFTRNVTLSPSGAFTFADIPVGDYTLAVKGARWLRQTVPVHATQNNVTGITLTLPAGDANNDNAVDVLDLDILIGAFDSAEGDPTWSSGADFNCDGSIDVLDLDLLVQFFDQLGES
ncbi:MAG: dockerin type I domain-containing protein [Chloroherpetonaceae bacterium]|nr:dockerin type I domain-containing protein [Chthonomonadaceae bacterium]MDW8207051.1 dockerin type I domain-containing protein [Chloroherpetonaceae bacterium]